MQIAAFLPTSTFAQSKMLTSVRSGVQSASRTASATARQSPVASFSTALRRSSAATPPAAAETATTPTHYLVTLLRSPLHLPVPSKATCESLGLRKRSSTSLIPINSTNAGYILKIKELVGVKLVDCEAIQGKLSKREERMGYGTGREGRRGAGLGGMGLFTSEGIVTVGKDRCSNEERGFKVVR